jgi:hypothetical protein
VPAAIVARAISVAKDAKGCDPRALGPRKASDPGASATNGTLFGTSKAFARFALLMLLPAHVSSLTAIMDANIGAAATAWVTSPTTTATTYGNIADWNTAAVTSMASVFSGKPDFNDDIGGWNTASTTSMSSMFSSTAFFNQDIGKWNVAAVTNMELTFSYTGRFNAGIGGWNTASLMSMGSMFKYANAFNQNIGKWNVASVSDMNTMFWASLSGFNQNLGGWNTASVSNMYNMFYGNNVANPDIGCWNTASVSTMYEVCALPSHACWLSTS